MKKPDQVIKKYIDNIEYEVKIFYTNAKHVYLTFQDNIFFIRGSVVNISSKKFNCFLEDTMLKIINKNKLRKKAKLEIDEENKQFYYFGNLVNYKIVDNLIIIYNDKINEFIKLPKRLNLDNLKKYIKKDLELKLIEKFKIFTTNALNEIYNKGNNLTFSIRNKKSSWASIVIDKNKINICSDLIYFSDEIIKYVAYHEICHLSFPNHSKKFWDLLKKYIPNYKDIKQKLNNHIFK